LYHIGKPICGSEKDGKSCLFIYGLDFSIPLRFSRNDNKLDSNARTRRICLLAMPSLRSLRLHYVSLRMTTKNLSTIK